MGECGWWDVSVKAEWCATLSAVEQLQGCGCALEGGCDSVADECQSARVPA